MESCYYLCENKREVKFSKRSELCGNDIVGVSSHDEARFLEMMIFSNEFQKSSPNFENPEVELQKLEIPIGNGKLILIRTIMLKLCQ